MGKMLSLAAAQLKESARLIGELEKRGVKVLEDGLENRLDDEKILEVSISRIHQHFEDNEFVVLTSWRQPQYPKEATPEERREIARQTQIRNEENFNLLRRQLRGMGLGHIRILGHGQEDIGGQVVDVVEPSLLVVNKTMDGDSLPDFLDRMIDVAQQYDQYAIVWHEPTQGPNLVQVKGDVRGPAATQVVDRMPSFGTALRQFYSHLWSRRGDPGVGTFSFYNPSNQDNNPRRECKLRVMHFPRKPDTLMEMMALHVLGDVGVLFYENERDAMADIIAEALESQG